MVETKDTGRVPGFLQPRQPREMVPAVDALQRLVPVSIVDIDSQTRISGLVGKLLSELAPECAGRGGGEVVPVWVRKDKCADCEDAAVS